MNNKELIGQTLSKINTQVVKITLDWDDELVGAGITVQEIGGRVGRFQGKTVEEACGKAVEKYGKRNSQI